MKNNLRMLIVCAALGFIFGGATNNFAQTEMKEPITGGYNYVATTDAQVAAAANFAVKAQAKKQRAKIKLTTIKKAEQQIVAGMNYSICLQVETRERGKKTYVPQTVQAVVFLSLEQKYELESWTVAACSDQPLTVPTASDGSQQF